jgi:hypothetical protein
MNRNWSVIVLSVVLLAGTARATVLWQADTNRGTAVFAGLNIDPAYGTITVAPDPLGQFGNVYRFFLQDTNSAYGKERTESSGTETPTGEFRVAYNTDYYIGWRAMWNPMPINGSWVALFQMHGYGVTGQGAPLVLRCVNGDGNVYMQNNANGVDTNFWHTAFKTNVWQTFVLHVFLSTNWTQGYTEIWYNGVLQTNNAGTTRWYGPTWDNVDGVWQDSYNKLKWGVYRSGSLGGKGNAIAYMSSAKVGSTYADVDPNGGGDFSMATAPSSQTVLSGGGTNFTVTIGALGGFATNVNLTAGGLPAGATAIFGPATVTNSGSSTLTVATSGSTPTGSYAISVVGTSGTLAHTNTVSLVVAGFTLSAAPPSQIVNGGDSTNFTVIVTTNGAFGGSVALGISGLPFGATAAFNPAALSQAGSSTLTIQTAANTPGGTFPLTISGTNGSLAVTTSATLTVNGAQAAPGTLFWTGTGSDTNWSTVLNWTNPAVAGNGPPGISNNVIFGNTGSGTTNVVDASTSINALWYQLLPASGGTISQTTLIASNVTLTVAGVTNVSGSSFVTGNYSLLVGTNNSANGNGSSVTATITGSAGTLNLTNSTGIVSVAQFNTSGNHPVPAASTRSILDMSGLGTFSANVGQLQVGCMNNGSAGTLYLAQNNIVTLNFTASTYTTAAGQGLDIGFNNSNAGDPSFLYLGVNNSIFVNNAITAACKGSSALLAFNPAFTNQNPSVFIRNVDGVDPVSYWNIGDLLTSTSTANVETPRGTNDFSGGTVDLSVNALTVAKTSSGASNPPGAPPGTAGVSSNRLVVGTLTFSAGTIAAINLTNGWQVPNMGAASSDTAIGTINVNGTGTLAVSNNFILAAGVASSYVGGNPTNIGVTLLTNGYYGPTVNATNAFAQGTLNLNGGTVQAMNLLGGGGISAVNLNSGTLDLQPNWTATSGTISNVSALNVGANGVSSFALLTDAAQISTTNTLNIAANGTVTGNTIFITPNLTVNGTLSPGNEGAGAMTNSGAITFSGGGSYAVTVDDAAAGPVVGWSFLQSGAGINIQSTAGNPFVIDVGTADNLAANFNSSSNYNWVIATASGGIMNFAANKFTVDASAFQNGLAGGIFSVTTNGNSLLLVFNPQSAPPVFSSLVASGTNLVFSGGGGTSGGNYVVLTSTNLVLPLANWTRIVTNQFDAGGSFIFTNAADAAMPQSFYLLQLP